eukprot:TRINITY_DN4542_c0_g1_i6.p1 TRINITY_DN4542_c0_g1~~TRINITY_DN4542_c0_g1_i6.p1  ORF type:complete len:1067 (+),score=194.96 TRINITY_DN4542_c0_g1_i6:160-3360(+)
MPATARQSWKHLSDQQAFFLRLRTTLRLEKTTDWTSIPSTTIAKYGGGGLLRRYDGSLLRCLQAVFPNESWNPLDFPQVPKGYWSDIQNQRNFLESISKILDLRKPSDWTSLSVATVQQHGGTRLLKYYNNSLYRCLCAVFPNESWDPKSFAQVPRGYWSDLDNQRNFLSNLGKTLRLENLSDWTSVTTATIQQNGGAGLLAHYDGSLLKCLEAVFPDEKWNALDFSQVPKGFWNDVTKQREFLQNLARTLDVKNPDDWASVSLRTIKANGGAGLLKLYGGSLRRCLHAVFPNERWDFLELSPKGHWDNIQNQRIFMENLFKTLKLKNVSDWSSVNVQTVEKNGGASLLKRYNNSLVRCLQALFPNEDWKLKKAPRFYWENLQHQREHMDTYAKMCGLSDWTDWTRVTRASFLKNGGSSFLVEKYGSLPDILRTVYPNLPWGDAKNIVWRRNLDDFARLHGIRRLEDWSRVTVGTFRNQVSDGSQILQSYSSVNAALKVLYAEHDWRPLLSTQAHHTSKAQQKISQFLAEEKLEGIMNYRISSLPSFSGKDRPKGKQELDIYFPSEKLAIEFQGQVHYSQLFKQQSIFSVKQNDEFKQTACRNANVTLVIIPYWWNRTKQQLIAMIRQTRPDLFVNHHSEVKALPTPDPPRLDQTLLMFSNDWKSNIDPKGRIMSEKMDGIRAYWDGTNLFSRSGMILHTPQEFSKDLPAGTPLDGELWCGRQSFLKSSALSRSWEQQEWKSAAFHPFDIPDRTQPFEARLARLRSLPRAAYFSSVEMKECAGQEDLITRLIDVVADGAEGLMLHDPAGIYEIGRSKAVLKVKPRFLDVVVVKKMDVGKRLLVQNSLGFEFKLNRSVSLTKFPSVSIGSVITITFSGVYPFGQPRFPNIVSHHAGVKFSDVIHYFLSTNLGPSKLRFDRDNFCRGCQRLLHDDERRIQVIGLNWSKGKDEPQRKILSFCPTLECVQLGSEKDQSSTSVKYPKFLGRIGFAIDLEAPFSLKRREAIFGVKSKKHRTAAKEASSELARLAEEISAKKAIEKLQRQGVKVEMASEKVLVNNHFCFVVEE